MNRRSFIKLLGSGLFVAAAPPIIFDVGKNLRVAPLFCETFGAIDWGDLRQDIRYSDAAQKILNDYTLVRWYIDVKGNFVEGIDVKTGKSVMGVNLLPA